MTRFPFVGAQTLKVEVSDRSAAIALAERANASIAKASEANLPKDEQRQVIDITEPAEFAPVRRTSDELVILRAWAMSDRVRTGFVIGCIAAAATCAVIAGMCAGSALDLAVLPLAVFGAGFLALPMIVNLVRQ
jgi:hypothetical protein